MQCCQPQSPAKLFKLIVRSIMWAAESSSSQIDSQSVRRSDGPPLTPPLPLFPLHLPSPSSSSYSFPSPLERDCFSSSRRHAARPTPRRKPKTPPSVVFPFFWGLSLHITVRGRSGSLSWVSNDKFWLCIILHTSTCPESGDLPDQTSYADADVSTLTERNRVGMSVFRLWLRSRPRPLL